jgi:hypothetical protein
MNLLGQSRWAWYGAPCTIVWTDRKGHVVKSSVVLALGISTAALLGAATWSRSVVAGPLDPPTGAVASSYKTLTEVEPRIAITSDNTPGDATCLFKITQAGSYYLTANTNSKVSGVNGIKITASNVTIDLNGYTLSTIGTSLSAIVTEGARNNITIRNGVLVGWDSATIDLTAGGNGANTGSLLENLRVSDGAQAGVIAGADAVIRVCTVSGNTGAGITTGANSLIADCIVRNNGAGGIIAGSDAVIRDCTLTANTGAGLTAGMNSRIAGCVARSNTGNGIVTASSGVITGCSAVTNGLSGIVGGSTSLISDCSADGNGTNSTGLSEGIFADVGSTISRCTSQNNTSILSGGLGDRGMGFRTQDRCTITDCTASRNRGHGFRIGSNSRVTGCTSIESGSGSTTSAGIYVTGSGSQIDDNQTNAADIGVQVIAAGNIIIRNTARGNGSNFTFVADNIYGPIIDRRIPSPVTTTALVNGSSATSTLGSTDANANFAY